MLVRQDITHSNRILILQHTELTKKKIDDPSVTNVLFPRLLGDIS